MIEEAPAHGICDSSPVFSKPSESSMNPFRSLPAIVLTVAFATPCLSADVGVRETSVAAPELTSLVIEALRRTLKDSGE